MKRTKPRKLRDRRTGQSPYLRHAKRELLYSGAYQQWALEYRPRKLSQLERNA